MKIVGTTACEGGAKPGAAASNDPVVGSAELASSLTPPLVKRYT